MRDPRLNANFNLLFMDARFHGNTEGARREQHKLEVRREVSSEVAETEQSSPAQNSAECLTAALDSLGVPSYTIYGEGVQGSPCAVWAALMRPEKVNGLILASPGWMTEWVKCLQ